ncbi:MAG: amidophosphoribosyltransferase [Bacteroidetes bacterium]|nr:amidophosphoribosyltransferase [Bacteroidota bacterium]
MSEDLREECGIFGVYGHPEAAKLTYLGLYSLQHRGQESTGIVSADGKELHRHVGMGLVGDVFADHALFDKLPGRSAIGHNRYSTTGGSLLQNAQPIYAIINTGPIAAGHNGNLVNYHVLRDELQQQGAIFQSYSDTEVILHLAAHSGLPNVEAQLKYAVTHMKGAYSLVMLTRDKFFAARDPRGIRPLCLGILDGATVVASESCAFDIIGAEYIRDVHPGEFIMVDEEGLHCEMLFKETKPAHCIFEFVYFSRPDSKIFGDNVDKARRKLGKRLAEESPVDADIVISVPDSSNTAALGYSRRSDVKFELGLIRNHYVGRTFIHPVQTMRDLKVKVKFNVVEGVLRDRRVVVIDDSIVRGTTLKPLVNMIRKAGAREVHVRISSPPVTSPCYYGMDFPTKNELIANRMTKEEICKEIGADSLEYLSMEGMLSAVPNGEHNYCTACFSGNYPIPVDEVTDKTQCELPLPKAAEFA